MKYPLLLSLIIIFSCQPVQEQQNTSDADRPNIILIMSDDQGFGDFGFNGNPYIKTPNLDKLHSESVHLSHFYVSPVCAPTRSSLMTGRYSMRTGVRDTYNGGAIMSTEELTIAELLGDAGYQTGIFGKWHLGDNYPFRPQDQGFNETFVHQAGGVGQVGDVDNYYARDSSYYDLVVQHNGNKKKTEGHCTDVFTNAAIDFLNAQDEDPFFLYLAYNAPHTPLQVPDSYVAQYEDVEFDSTAFASKGIPFPYMNERDINAAKRVYAMVTQIDDNIGRLMEALEASGKAENTLFIYFTDNGPQQRRYTGGLRETKGRVYEGGIRTSCLMRYPGKFEAGKEIIEPVAHIDMVPSLLSLAGAQHPNPASIDGKNFLPLIEGKENDFAERTYISYWQRSFQPRYLNMAIRKGDYKLVGQTGRDAEITDFELFKLTEDPFEQNNLVESETEIAVQLKDELDAWFEEAIREPHNKQVQYIQLGTEHENPVVLNRNDAAGQPGIWAQGQIFGYWNVAVMEEGKYDIKLHFREPIEKNGAVSVRMAPFHFKQPIRNEVLRDFIFEDVTLDKGEYRLEPWFFGSGKFEFPFYVEVEKK